MRFRPTLPDDVRWPEDALPAGWRTAMDRLTTYLVGRVQAGGVYDPCHSRVLESALALALLRGRPEYAEQAERIVGYLERNRAAAHPLEQVAVAAACGESADRLALDFDVLIAQAPEFTGRRKRAFFEALLIACGLQLGADGEPDEASFSNAGLHPWAEVQTTAVKLIWATVPGAKCQAGQPDVELLLATQGRDGLWEGNLLVHLSVLHALHRLGGHEDVVRAGVERFLAHQRPDGGIPFFTDTDTWCTATAGVALLAAGVSEDVVRAVADNLVKRQKPNGGWSVTDISEVTDIDDTSVTLELLQTLGDPAHKQAVDSARQTVLALRSPDGGFPTYIVGAPSEASMTAAAINGLTCAPPQDPAVLTDALAYLAGQQRPDGTFPPDWSASRFHTIFRAVLAASHFDVPAAHELRAKALDHVLRSQHTNGGWGQQPGSPSDPVSTAYALIALCHQPDPRPVAAGIAYLMAHQDVKGSIDSISDSIGPRPFVFRIPVLSDIFTLLAFGHVSHRMALIPAQVTEEPAPTSARP
ncbi:prenyltransferase/squalene oxidase repeat-containing protein [Kitasatospora sp. NPDC101235]|uniref:prenyltransferase/squalene oxidase repeat-containing protein n=1 Tax=Kitasatospora sp. NPDC101235 TaxID=3364101 RepID=UPI0038118201